jgi:hypothetical protein
MFLADLLGVTNLSARQWDKLESSLAPDLFDGDAAPSPAQTPAAAEPEAPAPTPAAARSGARYAITYRR